jgi:hypothetical protein
MTTTTPNFSQRGPFLGSRRMTAMLGAEGGNVNRKRVQRLMRLRAILCGIPEFCSIVNELVRTLE